MKKIILFGFLLLEACQTFTAQQKKELNSYRQSLNFSDTLDVDRLPKFLRAEEVEKAAEFLEHKRYEEVLTQLKDVYTPAAFLLKAKAHRLLNEVKAAEEALGFAALDGALSDAVQLERGSLALAQKKTEIAIRELRTVLLSGSVYAEQTLSPLLIAYNASPELLLKFYSEVEPFLKNATTEVRAKWLLAKAQAHSFLGENDKAKKLLLQCFLEEPVALDTPEEPPYGVTITSQDWLNRAQKLLDAHRNDRALQTFQKLNDSDLTPEELCQKNFGMGMAARKLRRYDDAEKELGLVVSQCTDTDLKRRAFYTQIKVVSIQSGLKAIDLIEQFSQAFKDHSMVDDVLFWAGDLYQRRDKNAEAQKYYQRVLKLNKADHCAEAHFRLAFMAYKLKNYKESEEHLKNLLKSTCETSVDELARARYWLGKVSWLQNKNPEAQKIWQTLLTQTPLHFYGQLAAYDWQKRDATFVAQTLPEKSEALVLCVGKLPQDNHFIQGLQFLERGLTPFAAQEFLAIKNIEKTKECPQEKLNLLLTVLLDKASAHQQAHKRMRDIRLSLDSSVRFLQIAYPLAYRLDIQQAELASQLPELALQALAREESALDPNIVSWAGAYGLTQLLVSSAQGIGSQLKPKVKITNGEALLDPTLNAHLGGALLGSLYKRYQENYALALVAYNAGQDVADRLWQRFSEQPIDEFVESIGIKETRDYVKRVTQTFGIYRFLYTQKPLLNPLPFYLPNYGKNS